MKSKIKAFTINEMIVVLLITTIVVGMAFSVLNLAQRQMHNIGEIYKIKTEVNKLRQVLWVDFNRFSSIKYDATNEALVFSNALEVKHYKIGAEELIRDTDTFKIKIKSKKMFFNAIPKYSGDVDALELQTSKETGNQYIFVYKENAPATYINE